MKEIVKTSSDPLDPTADNHSGFRGYTLEELRYQRALVALKKEFSQTKFLRNIDGVKKSDFLSPQRVVSSIPGRFGSVASKVFSGLSYLDYAMLGFSIFKSIRKLTSLFRKKKK